MSFQTKILLQAQVPVWYLPPLKQPPLGLQRNLTKGILQESLKRYIEVVSPLVLVLT